METTNDKKKVQSLATVKQRSILMKYGSKYSIKYLGATLFKGGSSMTDICIKIMTAAMARLTRVWCCQNIRFTTNNDLHKPPSK